MLAIADAQEGHALEGRQGHAAPNGPATLRLLQLAGECYLGVRLEDHEEAEGRRLELSAKPHLPAAIRDNPPILLLRQVLLREA